MQEILFENCRLYQTPDVVIEDGCLVARDGVLVYSGSRQACGVVSTTTPRVDLAGGVVFPAFTDSHIHFFLTAEKLGQIDLLGVDSLVSLKTILQKNHSEVLGEWICGHGWELEVLFQREQPSLEFLDHIFPENPVFLASKDWHSVYLNSLGLGAALQLEIPEKCVVEKRNGWCTGLIFEDILELKRQLVPPLSVTKKRELLPQVIQEFHKNGITTVHNNESLAEYQMLMDYFATSSDKLRMIWNFVPETLEDIVAINSLPEIPVWLSRGGIKLFLDGTLGSRTAAITHTYPGTDSMGLMNMEKTELRQWIQCAIASGRYCVFHTIGDRSTEIITDLIEEEGLHPLAGLAHRLEHIQFLTEKTLQRNSLDRYIFSAQPSHMVGDFEVARCNLSSELQRLSYLFSTLIARGGKLVFGSDSPIEGISVWKGIEAAITRSFQGGYWNQSEAISLASALNAHTVWPSQIQSNPHGTGALVVGNVCDFVLLNRDPFDVIAQGESLVHKMKILQTVQNGVTVYS